MASFVLCRRDISDFGEAPRFCAKPIMTPNDSNRCPDCLARLPLWPADDAVVFVGDGRCDTFPFTPAQEAI
jgi:hypothetical protein